MKSKSGTPTVPPGFKPSPIGPIPEDWEVVKLEHLASKITDGTHKTPKYVETGIPFLSTENLKPFSRYFDFSSYRRFISQEEHRVLIRRCNPEKGDLLIAKCGTIGRTQLIRTDMEFSIFVGLALIKLKKDSNSIIPDFLEQLFNWDFYRTFMEAKSPGSTRKTLTLEAISNLPIPLPPLPEQKRIAGVLRTVDEAIEKVEEEIEHTERLKRGLMQCLLTRGIGHARFKDTPLGKIPEDWEVVRLGDIGVIVTGKTPSTKIQKFWNGEIMFVTPTDYRGRKYINDTERYITKEGAAQAVLIPPNSVLVVCIASIGEIAINSDYCVTNQQINSIIPGDKVDTEFLYYVLKFRSKILKLWAGITTTPIVKKSLFEKFQIPLPPLPEQKKIAEILMTVDRKLELLRQKRDHMERLKKGLMNDLLTGRRRLRVSNAS